MTAKNTHISNAANTGPHFRLVNWNLAWAVPGTARGQGLQERIAAERPDLVCATESYADFFDDEFAHGHGIGSDPDYGYKSPPRRRKNMLWSRQPWRRVDTVGDPGLPGGRYVGGLTRLGGQQGLEVEVLSICIPWMNAHVATGQKNKKAWEEHLRYLNSLGGLLAAKRRQRKMHPLIIMGDFNQRIPRDRSPLRVYEPLMAALPDDMMVITTGFVPGIERPTVCHVLVSPEIAMVKTQGLENKLPAGQLSDHPGISVEFHIKKKAGPIG